MDNSSLDKNTQGDKMTHMSSNMNIILISNLSIRVRKQNLRKISVFSKPWEVQFDICVSYHRDTKCRNDLKGYELRKKRTFGNCL